MNDCVEHLVFEAHLSTSAGSHLNVTCVDHVTHLRSFMTRELFDRTISEVKVKVAGMCLFVYAMKAMDTHIHPLTKLWRALIQSGPLKRMFPEFFKLAEITMIHVRGYILKICYFIKYSHAFCIHVIECKLASY